MKIATFNINGVKARLPALLDWLAEAAPDAVVLQEIKSVDEDFPRARIEDAGYAVETHGQKGFNGVAVLSRVGLEDVTRGLPGDEEDVQARWIEATVGGNLRLCGLYLPNGNPAPGPKYDYKLGWMARLETRVAAVWATDALFLPATRAAYRRTLNLGLTDALRTVNADPGLYTFWDYQAGARQKNHGIRIDHILLTPQAADRLVACGVDAETRDREKPSDHVPVWAEIAA
jgi:exodeoxyribonuclease-3